MMFNTWPYNTHFVSSHVKTGLDQFYRRIFYILQGWITQLYTVRLLMTGKKSWRSYNFMHTIFRYCEFREFADDHLAIVLFQTLCKMLKHFINMEMLTMYMMFYFSRFIQTHGNPEKELKKWLSRRLATASQREGGSRFISHANNNL